MVSKMVSALTWVMIAQLLCACANAGGQNGISSNVSWAPSGPYVPTETYSFFSELKSAIRVDDITWLTEHVVYPLRVTNGKRQITIDNALELKTNYKAIFSDVIKAAVACQKFDDLSSGSSGIMVGQGAIWFDLIYVGAQPKKTTIDQDRQTWGDRTKWNYRITGISTSEPAEDFVKRCESGNKNN